VLLPPDNVDLLTFLLRSKAPGESIEREEIIRATGWRPDELDAFLRQQPVPPLLAIDRGGRLRVAGQEPSFGDVRRASARRSVDL